MQDRSGSTVHPAIARLHAELDAARQGIDVLGELEEARRERVVAELLSAVPDVASRAAYEAGADGVVATIQGFAPVDGDHRDAMTALWDRIVLSAAEAATAVAPDPVVRTTAPERTTTA